MIAQATTVDVPTLNFACQRQPVTPANALQTQIAATTETAAAAEKSNAVAVDEA